MDNIAILFSFPADIWDVHDTAKGRAPQHNAHVRHFRAVQRERALEWTYQRMPYLRPQTFVA